MITDFLQIDKSDKAPIYQQIYNKITQSIESGGLTKGSKLPSIRKLSKELNISKTTVESAYNQLSAGGYIKNIPQRGYFVEADLGIIGKKNETRNLSNTTSKKKIYKYDFSTKNVDYGTNLTEWKKEIKNILNKEYLLKSYGDPQGEYALRTALQRYAFTVRGVHCSADNIVIGAGTQTLLYILCGLIGVKKRVLLEKGSFVQAEQVFRDFGCEIYYYKCDYDGIDLQYIDKYKPDIVMLNPNFNTESGTSTSINRRMELIMKCSETGTMIFEDDYNGELRYSSIPTHCIQSYDCENTVYIGSFSKIMLPSVRIGYMVLPEKLLVNFNKRISSYNQTSSKTEQLALSEYISKGLLEKRLRKLRRIYAEKSKITLDALNKLFKNEISYVFSETSLSVYIKHKTPIDKDMLFKECEINSVRINESPFEKFDYIISFGGIETEQIPDGVKALKNSAEKAKRRQP